MAHILRIEPIGSLTNLEICPPSFLKNPPTGWVTFVSNQVLTVAHAPLILSQALTNGELIASTTGPKKELISSTAPVKKLEKKPETSSFICSNNLLKSRFPVFAIAKIWPCSVSVYILDINDWNRDVPRESEVRYVAISELKLEFVPASSPFTIPDTIPPRSAAILL